MRSFSSAITRILFTLLIISTSNWAQTAPAEPAPLSRTEFNQLLNEVRALRTQLLTWRLDTHQARIADLEEELARLRQEKVRIEEDERMARQHQVAPSASGMDKEVEQELERSFALAVQEAVKRATEAARRENALLRLIQAEQQRVSKIADDLNRTAAR